MRRRRPAARAVFVPQAPTAPLSGPVPAHSDACYCPVAPWWLLPCENCRRDVPTPATGGVS